MKEELRKTKNKVTKMREEFDKMKNAFHEYDMQSYQQLNDKQQQLMAYFPLDNLDEKVDFLFSNKNTAKTVAKAIFRDLGCVGFNRPNLTELVTKTAKKCFSGELRAQLHIVKKQAKE